MSGRYLARVVPPFAHTIIYFVLFASGRERKLGWVAWARHGLTVIAGIRDAANHNGKHPNEITPVWLFVKTGGKTHRKWPEQFPNVQVYGSERDQSGLPTL